MTGQLNFVHSKLKIDRAYGHIQQLITIFNEFAQSGPCKADIDLDPNTGRYHFKFVTVPGIPWPIPAAIGDAAHNLRCAFDYVTTHFVGKDESRVSFPVGKKRDDVITSRALRCLKEARADLADFIVDVVQPYEGGDFKVWEIAQLDNFDKHKFLIPILAAKGLTGVSARNDEGTVILENNTAIIHGDGTISLISGLTTPLKITDHGQPILDISFPEGSIFERKAVIPTLLQLTQLSAKSIDALEKFCFGNVSDPNAIK